MLTGTGKTKKMAKREAARMMWAKLMGSYIPNVLGDTVNVHKDEVRAGRRTEFSLSVVLVTALVFGRCCMPSMHLAFTVPAAYSSCSAL
jgi:hypothetical protein